MMTAEFLRVSNRDFGFKILLLQICAVKRVNKTKLFIDNFAEYAPPLVKNK